MSNDGNITENILRKSLMLIVLFSYCLIYILQNAAKFRTEITPSLGCPIFKQEILLKKNCMASEMY